MDSLTFRSATEYDLDRIMAMETAGFAPGDREAREVYARRIEAFPEGALLACLGAQTVGCVFTEIWRPVPIPAREAFALGHDIRDRHDPVAGAELYVASMTLDPAFRGRGLGKPLLLGALNHVAVRYPRVSSVLLLVNSSWDRARRLYAAAGFHEVTRLPGFFRPSSQLCEDGIVMRRALRPAATGEPDPRP